MTQDEIIRMATEAGFQPPVLKELWTQGYCCVVEATQIERFAALVAAHAKSEQINLAYQQGYEEGSAHEREACAKVCDEHGLYGAAPARDIRARSENGTA